MCLLWLNNNDNNNDNDDDNACCDIIITVIIIIVPAVTSRWRGPRPFLKPANVVILLSFVGRGSMTQQMLPVPLVDRDSITQVA